MDSYWNYKASFPYVCLAWMRGIFSLIDTTMIRSVHTPVIISSCSEPDGCWLHTILLRVNTPWFSGDDILICKVPHLEHGRLTKINKLSLIVGEITWRVWHYLHFNLQKLLNFSHFSQWNSVTICSLLFAMRICCAP